MKHTTFYILILLILVVPSCKKTETNTEVKIDSIIIKNEGEFTFTEGLIYAVIDSLKYELNLQTTPTNAQVFYSINGGEIHQKKSEFITLDSNDKYISFFSDQDGYCMTANNRLDFGFGNDSLPADISVFPNPFDSLISCEFNSNIRGNLKYGIYNVLGQHLIDKQIFLAAPTFTDSIDLSSYQQGVYFLEFKYGNTWLVHKLVKQ